MYYMYVENDSENFTLRFEHPEELDDLVCKSQYIQKCVKLIQNDPEDEHLFIDGHDCVFWYKVDISSESKEKTFTLSEVKELCQKYDDHYGMYPGHQYEGRFVFQFIEGITK